MKKFRFEEMRGGWFVGNFEPTAFKTPTTEVCYKFHPQGEKWPTHYHAIATEVNFLVRGSMKINNELLRQGDIFVIEPNEVASPEFLTDCEIVVVKVPSVPNDKYNLC